MSEVVNLRLARKRRQREEDAAKAAENRCRHGRTLSQRLADERQAKARDLHLDGHRLNQPDDE